MGNIKYLENHIFVKNDSRGKEGFSEKFRYPTENILEENESTSAIPPLLGESFSFKSGLNQDQRSSLNTSLAALGLGLLLQPILTTWLISWALFVLFSILIVWRFLLLFVGIFSRIVTSARDPLPQTDQSLPVYSILVAAYQEEEIMGQLAGALRTLDWPSDRLDIQILLEADDPETIAAAKRAKFPVRTRLTIVPRDGPRTKPNALNYGLARAEGHYITIYDVEDRPDPNQLRAAHQAFQFSSPRTVCLQAPLVGDNGHESWLAAQWALEYDVQFGLLLRGLSAYRMPILIGGTSNHFKRDALLALGGWDAWNVTEDADLGMRIARAGLWTDMIRTPTYEDGPTRFSIWLAQRSRWIKGFLQTWLVLMRRPGLTLRQMGAVPFLTMQLNLGGAILAPVLHGPFFLLALLALLSGPLEIGLLGWSLLSSGIAVCFLSDLAAPNRWSWSRLSAVLTRPLYWPLMSLAAYRAIWELANKPFFWAKTPHTPRRAEPDPSYSTGSSA